MSGFDWFLVLLLVAAVVVETIRGFGMSVLDLLAVYTAYLLTAFVAPAITNAMPGIGGSGANFTDFYVISFVVLSIGLLIGSRFAYNLLLWDLGTFDKFGGSFIGLVIGVVFCHSLLAGLSLGDLQQQGLIAGPVSQQLLTFSTFHQMIDGLQNLVGPKPEQS